MSVILIFLAAIICGQQLRNHAMLVPFSD